jgi:hypothetical protein
MMHVLIYETESVVDSNSPAAVLLHQVQRLSKNSNVNGSLFGQGQDFVGFGSKFNAFLPLLDDLPAEDIVVVADSRDVLLNNHNDETGIQTEVNQDDEHQLVSRFHLAYHHLMETSTHSPNAIIVSAESQCCVSALSHVPPGSYYNSDGSRSSQRACLSGTPGCYWKDDSIASQWEVFMSHVAETTHRQRQRYIGKNENVESSSYEDKFLNAGLIVGSVSNLRNVLRDAQIGVDEDDQAVLTDYMYHNPDMIVLDYDQTLFGNNRLNTVGSFEQSCPFVLDPSHNETAVVDRARSLRHTKTATTPMFIHSPGGNFECHNHLGKLLGVQVSSNHNVMSLDLVEHGNDAASDNFEMDDEDDNDHNRELQTLTRPCQYRGSGRNRRCRVRGDGLSSLLKNRTLSEMVLETEV